MELQWILVFISIIIIAMIAWHSSNATVSKAIGLIKPSAKRKTKSQSLFEKDLVDDDEYFSEPEAVTDPLDDVTEMYQESDDVFAINLRALTSHGFTGEQLVLQLNRAGLHFGDMDIFHYEEKTSSGTERLFSLASAFEPGVFDMDRIEHFRTAGLTLFMQANLIRNPRLAFETMLEVSERLATALRAEICDQNWQPLTESNLERYFQRIRTPRRAQIY